MRRCYHAGGPDECKSGHACPYATTFWMTRASNAEDALGATLAELRDLKTNGATQRKKDVEAAIDAIIVRVEKRLLTPVPGDSTDGLPKIASAAFRPKEKGKDYPPLL